MTTTDADPGGQIMVRYFFAWAPIVIVVGTLVLLANAYLVLIALMIVLLVALAALAWAILAVAYALGRTISRRWQSRSGASPQTATPSPAKHPAA